MRSPMTNGRSAMSVKPANMLARVSWAARPTASEPTPSETTSDCTSTLKCWKIAIRAATAMKIVPSLPRSGPNSRVMPVLAETGDSVEYQASRMP